MSTAKIYLTFDLEEFDIPNEYGNDLTWEEQINVSLTGLKNLLPVLEKHGATATFFTTAAFAIENVVEVNQLAKTHEVASHSYWHSKFEDADLLESVGILEQITGQKVKGLRMPRMKQVEVEKIMQSGFLYDSSINPTRLPGRYNYSAMPRQAFYDKGLLRIPASVTPRLRLPLFWLSFKNLPYWVFKQMAINTLRKDKYLNLYFHPWEFADLEEYQIPFYIKKRSGQKMLARLDRLISDLSQMGEFNQLQNFEATKSPS